MVVSTTAQKLKVQNLVTHTATEMDVEAIMKLRKEVDKDRANRNPPLDPYGGSYPMVEQQTEEIYEWRLFLVAEVEQEIVGVAFVFEMHHMAGDYRLKIVVRKNWRNKHIGTALASQIIEWAKIRHTVKEIVCAFQKSHRDAKHMLIKLGFSVTLIRGLPVANPFKPPLFKLNSRLVVPILAFQL